MTSKNGNNSRVGGRPNLTSYDSGYEHSVERVVDARNMLEDTALEMLSAGSTEDQEPPKALAAKAS